MVLPFPLAVSFLQGSTLIIATIVRTKDKRFTTYRQLVLGISVFDLVSSMAYMLVGVMAPYEAGFYLSRGNTTTCRVQGFLIQLGQTASMFYNLCLSVWFKKIILWGHALVVMGSFAFGVGALPFIKPQFGVCGILPPLTASQWEVSLFYTAPVSVVLFTLTVSTVAICWHVNTLYRRAQKWRFGNNNKRNNNNKKSLAITREVFWQSFWYVLAFYVTLPLMLLSFYVPFQFPRDFWIFVVTAIFAPLQGSMNALVYFHRSKLWPSSCCVKCCARCSYWNSQGTIIPTKAKADDKLSKSSARLTGDVEQTDDALECGGPTAHKDPSEDPMSGVLELQRSIRQTQSSRVVNEEEENRLDGQFQQECATQDATKGVSGYHHRFEEDAAVLEYWTLNEGGLSDIFGVPMDLS